MNLKELGLEKNDKKYLGLILLITTILVIYYINFSMNIGIFCSDVYVYLINGLYYSGENIGANNDLWLTPLISILTSLFFDLGLKNQISIFIVTGILAIVGNIGLYILFRLKFDETLSFLGVIIYATFSLNLIWLANGSIDIPAVSLMIWTALFGIIAVDRNPKFYLLTIIMFFLGFLIRYTVVLILPPLLIYFIYKKKYKAPWSEIKYLVIPVIVVGAITAVVLIALHIMNGEIKALDLGMTFIKGEHTSANNPAYNTNIFYYAQNFFNFLGSSGVTFFDVEFFKRNPQLNNPTIISAIYGIILIAGGAIALKDNIHGKFSKKYLGLTIVLAILTTWSFTALSSTPTVILLLITMIAARKTFKSPDYDLSLMFLTWLLINFIFISHVDFKVNRYFIPSLPAVAYFIVYGIYKIQEHMKINKNIIPIILTAALLVSAFTFVYGIEDTDVFLGPQKMGEYIVDEHPDYKDVNVSSNTIRPYKWYLEQKIYGVKSSQLDLLSKYNITYYISNEHIDHIDNFTEIKSLNGNYLYQRV